MQIARWAAGQSERVLALVTTHDASGRRVTPPVDLDLALDRTDATASYGLSFALPERVDAESIREGQGTPDRLTVQVDAEWLREGSAFSDVTPTPLDELRHPLDQYLHAQQGRYPEDLRPWLGAAGPYPGREDGLPPHFKLSASKLGAFTQCLYKAWCGSVMQLREPEEITEDLDAREVGDAVHKALEVAARDTHWVVPDDKVDEARAMLLERLCTETDLAITSTAEERLGVLDSEALGLARTGLAARWRAHWPNYVEKRILSVSQARQRVTASRLDELDEGLIWRVVNHLAAGLSKTARGQTFGALKVAMTRTAGRLEPITSEAWRLTQQINGKKNHAQVAERLSAEPPPASLVELCTQARALTEPYEPADSGDHRVLGLEIPFGKFRETDARPRIHLQLGSGEVEVRGFIDVVSQRDGNQKPEVAGVRIEDFKTGSGKPGWREQIDRTFVRPQLVFYALVVQELGGFEGGAPVRPEEVAYDWVRKLDRIQTWIDHDTLERASTTFGALLDRGRRGDWALQPHPDGCPVRGGRKAYCDFQNVCRLRSTFAPEEESP